MLEWLGLPVAASAHAAGVDHIMVLVHWLMFVLFVGWGSFFVYVLFRFRSRRNPKASYAGARGRFASVVEAGVVSLGLRTMLLPAARAGATFQIIISSG